MKSFFKQFEIRRIIIPAGLCIFASFIYSLLFILSLASLSSWGYWLQMLIALVFAPVMYELVCWAWKGKKERLNGRTLLLVLYLQAIWVLLAGGILRPLYMNFYSNSFVLLLVEVLAAVALILYAPVQLSWWWGLYKGETSFKGLFAYVKKGVRYKDGRLISIWCLLFLAVVALNSLVGGMYSLQNGLDAVAQLENLIFMGNPMYGWMSFLFAGLQFGYSLSQLWLALFLHFAIGLVCLWLGFNYALFVQKNFVEMYGTVRTAGHGKKKSAA